VPSLFVLSAKSEDQLKSYAQEMKRWIQAHEEQALEDIAFTLQVGRQAMDYRLAIVADAREVLLQRLEGFVDNHAVTGIYTAQVKKSSLGAILSSLTGNNAMLFDADADGQSLLRIWCQKKELPEIAQSWVRGANIDWMLLYTPEAGQATVGTVPCACPTPTAPIWPHRISLPTYPFAQERYWVSSGSSPMVTETAAKGLTSAASLAAQSSHRADSDGEETLHKQLVETEVGEVLMICPERQPSFLQNLRNYRLPTFMRVPSAASASREAGRLQDMFQDGLREIAAEMLNVKCEEIENGTALLEYGFDLVALTEFINRLNQTYHLELTPAILEEWYKAEVLTVQWLAHYLVQRDPDTLRKYVTPQVPRPNQP